VPLLSSFKCQVIQSVNLTSSCVVFPRRIWTNSVRQGSDDQEPVLRRHVLERDRNGVTVRYSRVPDRIRLLRRVPRGRHTSWQRVGNSYCLRGSTFCLIILLRLLNVWLIGDFVNICMTHSNMALQCIEPYNLLILAQDYSKNFTKRLKLLTIGHMAMFVVKSIVIRPVTRTQQPGGRWFFLGVLLHTMAPRDFFPWEQPCSHYCIGTTYAHCHLLIT